MSYTHDTTSAADLAIRDLNTEDLAKVALVLAKDRIAVLKAEMSDQHDIKYYPDRERIAVLEAELAAAKKYAVKNPLGGPATMFDTIAARIRAGEPVARVLDDYDLAFIQKKDP